MEVKNNYNVCLTNVACSIRKYFDLDYKHNTLKEIDDILDNSNPQNVLLILFDGMGSRILDRTLDENSFLRKNKLKEITTIFPATTTAATTSITTGLNPCEHGYMGWNTYIKDIDKTIQLFLGCEKGKTVECSEFIENKPKFEVKTITNEINNKGLYYSMDLFPFGENKYNDLDDMFKKIEEEINKPGKKYIYAYDEEPDHTMHDFGPDSKEVKELIKIRNKKVEELCSKIHDTLVIVVADHGHVLVDNILLNDYPEIINLLERTTSLEPRATSFKIKDGYHDEFVKKFNELFGNYYKLYTKEDVIKSKLFGDGDTHPNFESALGDFIGIAYTNKTLIYNDVILKSHHAGYLDDEIYIPLIIINVK